MPRIAPIDPQAANPETAETLAAVKAKLGVLPNLFTTLAHSPAALNGYLQLGETLSQGRLTSRQREMIAIAVAQENRCEYCLSAHAAIGKGAGLSSEDIDRARNGGATDALDDAITDFAVQLVRGRATVTGEQLQEIRDGGVNDGLVMEIIAHVALNVLTNYVNRVADTEVDFPRVDLLSAA